MLQEKKIYVYFDNNVDKRIKVGCLFADFQRGKEKFSFEYDDEFFTSFLFRNFFDYDLQPYIKIKGKEIEVNEEVYRAYVRPIRAEQRRKRREWKCNVRQMIYNLLFDITHRRVNNNNVKAGDV